MVTQIINVVFCGSGWERLDVILAFSVPTHPIVMPKHRTRGWHVWELDSWRFILELAVFLFSPIPALVISSQASPWDVVVFCGLASTYSFGNCPLKKPRKVHHIHVMESACLHGANFRGISHMKNSAHDCKGGRMPCVLNLTKPSKI